MTSRSIARRAASPCANALATAVLVLAATSVHAAGDATRGAKLYKDCGACHSIQANGAGPAHKGVFGRLAGKAPGYDYSPELKNSNIVWNEDNLDKWLTDPEKLVPGTKMFFDVESPQDRADIIAFLKEKAK